MADSRQLDAAVVAAGPGAGDAHPAGAFVVHAAGPVPVELDFDAAKLVAVDFLAGGADHGGGLDAGGAGRCAVGVAGGPPGNSAAQGAEAVAVEGSGAG